MMTMIGMFIALWYTVTYLLKLPCRTSALSGEAWVNELLKGNRRRFRENLRMSPETWQSLESLLILKGLGPSRYVSINEKMSIFYSLLAMQHQISKLRNGFNVVAGLLRSKIEIAKFSLNIPGFFRSFNEVMEAILKLYPDFVKLPNSNVCPDEISNSTKIFLFSKIALEL